TIEAALAAAQPGDTIEIAPDTYMLASYDGITVPAGVTLAGTGAGPDDTVVKAYSASASDTTSASLVTVSGGTIRNLTFSGARCTADSSSTYRALNANSGATVSDCVFTDTRIDRGTGNSNSGRVANITGEGTLIERSVIRNTTHVSGRNYGATGVVVALQNGAVMTDSFVTNNQNKLNNIGMVHINGASTLRRTVVANNRVLGWEKFSGASPGIKVHTAGAVIEDCIVENNSVAADAAASKAFDTAAGIYLNAAATVRRTIVRNNTAVDAQVGGIWAAAGASSIENCLIYGNRVTTPGTGNVNTYFYTGGLRVDVASTKVYNCTVTGNAIATEVTRFRSHGAYFKNVAAYAYNCIFWGNGPAADSVNFRIESGSTAKAYNSCIQGTYASNDCINDDPLFLDTGIGDYRLHENSPCRNAGASVAGAPADDLGGNARPQEVAYDMGCYEYVYTDQKLVESWQSATDTPPSGGSVSFAAYPNHVADVVSHTWTVTGPSGAVLTNATVTGSDEWTCIFPRGYATYTVSLTTTWSDNETASAPDLTVRVALGDSYVSSEGSNEAPYDTWAKAAHSIADAVAAVYGNASDDPGIVHVAPGVYTSRNGGADGGAYLVSVAKSVRLVGEGTRPEDVVFDGEGTNRVLSLTGANSGASNLMIVRARTSSTATSGTNIGFGLHMTGAGAVVENCIISNAVTTGASEGSIEHWVYVAGGGVITNSVIRNATLNRVGRAIYVANGVIGSSKIVGVANGHKTGGVVTVDGANSALVDCDIYGNTDYMREYGYRCGAVAAGNHSTIRNCRIFNNTMSFNRSAYYLGAGINAFPASGATVNAQTSNGGVLIEGCVITNNTTSLGDTANSGFKNGATGVLVGYGTTMRNCLVANNRITQHNNTVKDHPLSGGIRTASAAYASGALVENCTIAGNTCVVQPSRAGAYLAAGSMLNSIVWGCGGQPRNAAWSDGNLALDGGTATY
ncbi:MAG: hypothetical protein IJK04_09085, partial [Kiritimatiellae bacterium]|nr:hypothetical protein [Kiritimatiellia bacterium]